MKGLIYLTIGRSVIKSTKFYSKEERGVITDTYNNYCNRLRIYDYTISIQIESVDDEETEKQVYDNGCIHCYHRLFSGVHSDGDVGMVVLES